MQLSFFTELRQKSTFLPLSSKGGALAVNAICFLLNMLFAYTAITKLMDYETFKMQLGQSPFITEFASFISWSIPLSEFLIVIALIVRGTKLLGLYGALFLMTIFTAYVYSMLFISYDLPCSCGGVIAKMSWDQHLWFNIGFMLLCIAAIILEVKNQIQAKAINQK